jgi:aminoglycoside phosphotransferase (APT) family kinase protein
MYEKWMEPVLAWASHEVGRGARVERVEALRENPGIRGPWILHIEHHERKMKVLLKTGAADPNATRLEVGTVSLRGSFATEVEALKLAEKHKLAAPRLIAVDLEGKTGVLAILSTVLTGTSRPRQIDIRSLRTLGTAAATLHAIPLSPQPDLPLRTRPRQGENYITQRRWAARYQAASDSEKVSILDEALREGSGWPADGLSMRLLEIRTTPLIQTAEDQLRELPVPIGGTVLVHDDLCGGNTVWKDGDFVGIVDWEGAGAGHYGIDLGNLRMEESLTFGLSAADEILAGWQEASGQDAEDIAYWDLVAALNTPSDLSRWAPTLPRATENRDAFLRAALERL